MVQGVRLVADQKVLDLEKKVLDLEKAQAEAEAEAAAAESGSSSQTSTAKVPWDKPFVRAMNMVKGVDELTRPHMGRVIGVGGGRKHIHHGLAVPSTKESRYEVRQEKRRREMEQSAETERLRAELEEYKAGMEQKLDDHWVTKFNQLMPSVVQSIVTYVAEGQKGPLPVISMGSSNSTNLAPPVGGAPNIPTPATGNGGAMEDSPRGMEVQARSPVAGNGGAREDSPREMEVQARTPAAGNVGATEDSPALAADSTTRPSPGPSPLAMIDALTVINTASQSSASLLVTSLPPSLTSYMFFAGEGGAMHLAAVREQRVQGCCQGRHRYATTPQVPRC